MAIEVPSSDSHYDPQSTKEKVKPMDMAQVFDDLAGASVEEEDGGQTGKTYQNANPYLPLPLGGVLLHRRGIIPATAPAEEG